MLEGVLVFMVRYDIETQTAENPLALLSVPAFTIFHRFSAGSSASFGLISFSFALQPAGVLTDSSFLYF